MSVLSESVVSAPVRFFFIVMRPVVWLLEAATEIVLKWLGLKPPGADDDVLSEAELRMLEAADLSIKKKGELVRL